MNTRKNNDVVLYNCVVILAVLAFALLVLYGMATASGAAGNMDFFKWIQSWIGCSMTGCA